jgi:hypothetical protein
VKLDSMSKTARSRWCKVLSLLWLRFDCSLARETEGKKEEDVNEMMRREGPSKTIVSSVVSPRPVEVVSSVAA